MAKKVTKEMFDVMAQSFKEVTGLTKESHPEAFIEFCNYLSNCRLENKLDKIIEHFDIETQN